jgi:type I restriction enzyme R subunit
LTPTDLDELENMLRQAGATDPLLVEAKSQGLGLFIRSLVGLERDAAMQAFSELLQGGKATPEQIEFLELVIDELTQNGVMPPERLFESPFTDVSAKGPLGVFPPKKVTQIVSVLNEIQTRAAA